MGLITSQTCHSPAPVTEALIDHMDVQTEDSPSSSAHVAYIFLLPQKGNKYLFVVVVFPFSLMQSLIVKNCLCIDLVEALGNYHYYQS